MAMIGNSPDMGGSRYTQRFTAAGQETTFTVGSGYSIGYLDVYLNGVKVLQGTDYTASDGTTVVFTEAVAQNDVIELVSYKPGQMVHPGARGGAGNHVFFESDTTIFADYEITSGKNALTAGPVTINSGVTVTVPTGARWVIV